MREEKKKNKIIVAEVANADYDKCIEELAQALAEGMRVQRTTSLEPFEVYAERVKAKILGDMNKFRTRFTKGYQVLLEELAKNSQSPS